MPAPDLIRRPRPARRQPTRRSGPGRQALIADRDQDAGPTGHRLERCAAGGVAVKTLKDQWFRFPRQLLESPAWSVLNIHERRAFDRIMEEHQSKSGFVHDGLVVTYRDFVKAGIQSRHVARSLRVLRQLGIIDCTRNMGGSASGRTPNMWRPTFLPRTPTLHD